MTKYLIKQIDEKKINDDLSFKISRAKRWSCRQSLEKGLYRDAGYINAENLNEVFRIGNTEPDKIEKIDDFYSISCGNIIVNLDTKIAHLVCPIGFAILKVDAI
jgi:hypothetical protein|tara:strand:+ start:189 stop:500 length:312 start_codon:yes stop_codon:yes gene_type:complete